MNTQCQACSALESRLASQRRDYQERHDEMRLARDRATLKASTLERENATLKRTSSAAKERQQEKRQRQLDLEELGDQVQRWRERHKEAGREIVTLKQEITRLEQVEENLLKTLKEVLDSNTGMGKEQLEKLTRENKQLHAALLGARARIRKAELAADARVRKAEQALDAALSVRSPGKTLPSPAPEGWQHTITVGEHLRECARLQRIADDARRGAQ